MANRAFFLVFVCIFVASSLSKHIDQDVPEHIISPLPWEHCDFSQLPAHMDWRNVSGINYATKQWNQHNPHYCGSCWAMSSSASFGDRLRIMTGMKFPMINISPQTLIDCVSGSSCEGGSMMGAYRYMRDHGIGDETCAPYRAVDQRCTKNSVCQNCWRDCEPIENPKLWYAEEYGSVIGEHNMMAEIYARGPISCGIADPETFHKYSGGIYHDREGHRMVTHDIQIAGWGEEDGQKYWIGRNSWGTNWGEEGWFRLARGIDNLCIETAGCAWVVPKRGQV